MKIFAFILLFLMLIPLALSHEDEVEERRVEDIKDNSLFYLLIAAVITTIFVVISIHASKQPYFTNKKKMILFLGMAIPIILASIYLVSATIYINVISETKGPVHWHADFEIYACGNKIDLVDPVGISNRVGTSVFHEHGDNRIHVEGVVVVERDIDFHSFFEAIGGGLEKDSITIPLGYQVKTYMNGDKCNGYTGTLQVFVYKTIDGKVVQEKLTDFENYVLSPESLVPPGDCIIIEFDEIKEKTKHICETYRIAIQKGELIGG